MAARFDRIFEAANDRLLLWIIRHFRKILFQRFPAHRQAVAVQKSIAEKHFHQRHDPANLDQFRHQMFAARFEIG